MWELVGDKLKAQAAQWDTDVQPPVHHLTKGPEASNVLREQYATDARLLRLAQSQCEARAKAIAELPPPKTKAKPEDKPTTEKTPQELASINYSKWDNFDTDSD